MTRSAHDEARELIALGGDVQHGQQTWLQTHLDGCESCRRYAEASGQVVRALRSLPVAADSRLVRATQMRVRFHASRLREARERMWLVGMACLGVGVSTTLTFPLFWRLFAWIGKSAGISTLVWEAGFSFFFTGPALVVSVLLLARGTHLAKHGERSGPLR